MSKFTIVRDFDGAITLPDRVIISACGAYDLEKKGMSGYYTWIGYQHKGWASENKMIPIIRDVADQIAKYLSNKYNGKAIVQDYIKSFDMYRVYIETEV